MKISDYDVWYEECDKCGYDTGRSTVEPVKRCWKCGNRVWRDYSDRALKPTEKETEG